ncbi:hypothetical protein [Metabacillus sp. SLBN-84]
MNTRDTSKNRTENQEIQTIEHETVHAPVFEGDLDPITLLEMLDHHIETLSDDSGVVNTERVRTHLQSLEIITMENGDKTCWMNEPPVLHHSVMRRSMTARISHLFKTRGEWKSEHIKQASLEVNASILLPIELAIQPETERRVKDGDVSTLLLSVIGLRHVVESMIVEGATRTGVFKKPDGIVQMNRTKSWIEENEKHGVWSMKNDLATKNLYEIVSAATFTVNT